MAKCWSCGESGWRLVVDSNGVCLPCANQIAMETSYTTKAILHSLEIAETSRYHIAAMGHLNSAEKSVRELMPYHQKGISLLSKPLPEVLTAISGLRETLIERAIREQTFTARQKAQDGTTDAGKLSGYRSAIDVMQNLMDEVQDITALEDAVRYLRAERDALKAKLLCQKAEVQIAKGKTKKAVEYYIEAYMSLLHDGTSDDLQSNQLTNIGQRIEALGGTIPT